MKAQCIIVLLAIILLSGTTYAQSYELEGLNFNAGCGGICSFGRGINDRGDVVGWGVGGLEFPTGPKGFKLDEHGNLTVLEFPGAAVTQANGINDRGDIVGLYVNPRPDPMLPPELPHAFLLDKKGNYHNIDIPDSTTSEAWGINSRGQVVGQYNLPGDPVSRAFVRNRDGSFHSFEIPAAMVPIGRLRYTRFRDINDYGQIVGYYAIAGGIFPVLEVHGFLLDNNGGLTPIDFPVGPQTDETVNATVVHGINNRGTISGGYIFGPFIVPPQGDPPPLPFPVEHGFVRTKKGVYMTVDFAGMRQTEIYKVSESGVLVGGSQGFDGESNAFLAHPVRP